MEIAAHAERLHHLGVAQIALQATVTLAGKLARLAAQVAGQARIQCSQREQDHCCQQTGEGEQRMQQVHHQQIDRQPGGIQDGDRTATGHILSQAGQIRHRLAGHTPAGAVECLAKGDIKSALLQLHIQAQGIAQ